MWVDYWAVDLVVKSVDSLVELKVAKLAVVWVVMLVVQSVVTMVEMV